MTRCFYAVLSANLLLWLIYLCEVVLYVLVAGIKKEGSNSFGRWRIFFWWAYAAVKTTVLLVYSKSSQGCAKETWSRPVFHPNHKGCSNNTHGGQAES
jgi:hypothetical protein